MTDSERFPLLVNLIKKIGRYFVYSVNSDSTYSVADFLDGSIEKCTESQMSYLMSQTRIFGASKDGIKPVSPDKYVSRLVANARVAGYAVDNMDFQYCVNIFDYRFREFEELLINSSDKHTFIIFSSVLDPQSSLSVMKLMNRGDILADQLKYRARDTNTGKEYHVSGYQVTRALKLGHEFGNLIGGMQSGNNVADFLLVDNIIVPIGSVLFSIFSNLSSNLGDCDGFGGALPCKLSRDNQSSLLTIMEDSRRRVVFSTYKQRDNTFACSLRDKRGNPPWILFEFMPVSIEDVLKYMSITSLSVDYELRGRMERSRSPKNWINLAIQDLPDMHPSHIRLDEYIKRNYGFMSTAGIDFRVVDLCLE